MDTPLYQSTMLPHEAAVLGPVCTAALLRWDCPEMPPGGVRYALVPRMEPRGKKPFGYDSLAALARRIHRDRAGDALQLKPARLRFQDEIRDVVEILAEDAGGRVRRIGFAWIGGAHWRVLEAALDAELPTARLEAYS